MKHWKRTAKKAGIGAAVGAAAGTGYAFATGSDNILLDVAVFTVLGATTPVIVDAIDDATAPKLTVVAPIKKAK